MPTGPRRQRDQPKQRRGTAHRRGYGRRWQKYARSYLAQHPFCECGQCPEHTVAECVDHIIPVTSARDPLFWLPTNHQAMSFACHRRKTNEEDNGAAIRGTARTETETEARQIGTGTDARCPRIRFF